MSMMEYYEVTAQQIKAEQEHSQALAFVRATVPPCELWAQLAEEAAELAHAALKLRRSTGGANPTPVEPSTAFASVMEEIADVMLLVHVLQLDTTPDAVEMTGRRKLLRWRDRLVERMVEREEESHAT
jgi:NTP pyrophosphatase (non-canonical NTP hydrolase)